MVPASLYEAVFNASPTGHYLLSPTPEAFILAVNDAFLRASGRRREDLLGVSLFVAFPRNADDPNDTGEDDLRQSLARVLATGQVDTMPGIRYPIRVELPSGEVRFEERFWNAVSTPIFDASGQLVCISHSTSDVTAMIRAEAARSESEKRFRALVSASAEVVYRMNPDWTELHQLEGRGFVQDTLDARPLWIDAYIPPQDHALVRQAIEAAIRARAPFEAEHRVRRLDGSYGWAYSRAVPMLDARGEIYEWIGAASDITDRKRAEEKLLEASRRKDEFLAMLAHELRNPLAPIGAAAQLLQTATLDAQRVQYSSRIISRQIRHMTGLIDDLLDVSRVSRGLIELDEAALDIRHIATNAVEQATPLIEARRHRLALRLPPGCVTVMGDEKRLVQVVANLLNNAAKYTPEGGNIALAVEVHDGEVAIEVADDGIGMERELTERAFELFAQARRSSDRASGGLGLGLALVKSLVELHHGSVGCASAGIGKGSRFTVRLPCASEQQSGHPGHASSLGLAASANALRVMVVDDNVDAAAMLAMVLETLGHQVQVEHAPLQALARGRSERPQVFLLDIGLPEIDGNELARRLRAQPETAGATLIAVTGYGQDSDRQVTLAAGFDHHLVKPVDLDVLAAILAQIR
ncbi:MULTISPECIES: ATP-binding protein [unclassified Massilia]|uniref:PAS domain-containing hybrid sensor histidine kinase/response regulator n=1 Tax=unclassified Massilia TaxID=2609279 RepID=UPI001783CAEE|nr:MULTISPECIES: ATP-binding protein [unclassified Massilia]MBD8530077.1 PAS domain-containing protein [Massilia sp. CFBP 13647]MBD8674094.1 PAS domain-containing protein [Massilia sp. CFBP 13721]